MLNRKRTFLTHPRYRSGLRALVNRTFVSLYLPLRLQSKVKSPVRTASGDRIKKIAKNLVSNTFTWYVGALVLGTAGVSCLPLGEGRGFLGLLSRLRKVILVGNCCLSLALGGLTGGVLRGKSYWKIKWPSDKHSSQCEAALT